MALMVRVLKNRVMIGVKKRSSLRHGRKALAACQPADSDKSEWLDEGTADAITKWAEGKDPCLRIDQNDEIIKDMQKREGLAAFSTARRELAIYADRIEICGIQVWTDQGVPDLREALLLLSEKVNGGYSRLKGPVLMEKLGRDPSNPIGKPIKDFCDRSAQLLAQHRGLACGRYDIIASEGGYHLTDWIDVKIIESDKARQSHGGNERQESGRRLTENPFDGLPADQVERLRQICAGLSKKGLSKEEIRRLSGVSRAQLTRDIKALDERSLILKTGLKRDRLYRLADNAMSLMSL